MGNNQNKFECFSIEDFKQPHVFCSDCWRSQSTNIICQVLFWTYVSILVVAAGLMFEYFQSRPKTTKSGFLNIFMFTIVWIVSLVVYFTEAYIDYHFKV